VTVDLFHRLLVSSFTSPGHLPVTVDREISRNRSLHSRDRRDLTGLLYDAARWRRRIWGDIAPSTVNLETVRKNLDEARALRHDPPLAKWSHLSSDALARELSFPTWIVDAWIHEIGFQSTVSLALALNEPAPVTLRVNTLKTTREKLKALLAKEDVPTEEGKHSPLALHLRGRQNLQALSAYKGGLFEIQEEASQVAVLAAHAKPGETVVDVCCGAGGKSLAFAALLENRGKVVAVDADARKLPELAHRAKRAGAKIVSTQWVAPDDPNPVPELVGHADAVFVDVPCSAFGALRRRPWMKWELTAAQVEKLPQKQRGLVTRYAALAKRHGRVVYATCTLRASENQDVVNAFLAEHSSFREAEPARTLRPDVEGTDGFFIAVLKRAS
jgi:16S rRNA (cytosine967-C5)-methyltransferase